MTVTQPLADAAGTAGTAGAAGTAHDNASVLALHRDHVFQSWAAQVGPDPVVVAGGKGSTVWDFEGHEWLDFSSQLVFTNMGYGHPKIVAAIQEQAAMLAALGPANASAPRGEAAKRIADHAPDGMNKVFFTNAGADAVENGMRLARLFTGRDKIISRYRSYHGNTGGAIVATGDWRRIPNEFARGHVHVFGPYLYRTEFNAQTEQEECERALHLLERTIQAEGASTIAAILLESVPGTAGIMVPPDGYLQGVREIATRYGIMMIADEVMAGFGRTGRWFAFEHFGITPDLITFAKGVNSGYVPLGGVIMSDEIAHHFDDRVFPGGLTYSGHPLATASAVATIDAMDEEGVVEHAAQLGTDVIGPQLQALMDAHPSVGEVRGLGAFWAIELVEDRDTRVPLAAATMGQAKRAMLDRGLLPFVQDNRIHVVPPLVITADEVTRGVGIIDDALSSLGL